MARVKAPLMSLDASGAIAHTICFSKWKGRAYVRNNVTPHNPKSGLQVGMRAMMRFVTQSYAGLTSGQKANWAAAAKSRNITAMDQQVSHNQVAARQNFGYTSDPTNVSAGVEAAPGAVVATAQPKSINLTWTDSAGAHDTCTLIYMSKTNGFTPDISNLVRLIQHGTQKFTVDGLTTGTPYYFVLAGSDWAGVIGTHAGQVTATPT